MRSNAYWPPVFPGSWCSCITHFANSAQSFRIDHYPLCFLSLLLLFKSQWKNALTLEANELLIYQFASDALLRWRHGCGPLYNSIVRGVEGKQYFSQNNFTSFSISILFVVKKLDANEKKPCETIFFWESMILECNTLRCNPSLQAASIDYSVSVLDGSTADSPPLARPLAVGDRVVSNHKWENGQWSLNVKILKPPDLQANFDVVWSSWEVIVT